MPPRPDKSIPGSELAKARRKWDLNQEDCAELFGIERPQLSRIENTQALTRAWVMITKLLEQHGPKIFRSLK